MDIGNGSGSRNTGIIKQSSTRGADLTYVRLEVKNLSPGNDYRVTFNGEEHVLNNEGITGFFMKRPPEGLEITLLPNNQSILITPENVQSTRITIDLKTGTVVVGYDPTSNLGSSKSSGSDRDDKRDKTSVDILINGKEETAATATTAGGDTILFHGSMIVLPEYNMAFAALLSGGSSLYAQVMGQTLLLETPYILTINMRKQGLILLMIK